MKFEELHQAVSNCRKCSRLVEWREKSAREKTRRFEDWEYWGRPVPGFGDPRARVWIVGLAPAAHGGNRTGRVFTGDRSGDWLFRALHKAGFANQAKSISRDDGMALTDVYISASVRCAPPQNKPTSSEYENCRPYLLQEFHLLRNLRIILCLGQIAFRQTFIVLREVGVGSFRPLPRFGHGLVVDTGKNIKVVSSYHPSQQNTFTGKLTVDMFDDIFQNIRNILSAG